MLSSYISHASAKIEEKVKINKQLQEIKETLKKLIKEDPKPETPAATPGQ